MKSSSELPHQKKITLEFVSLLKSKLDRLALYPGIRWTALAAFLSLTLYRTITQKCLGVICFLFFYIVYLTLQFLTPAGLPLTKKEHSDQLDIFDDGEVILRLE
jgi:hypothetical protein